jgi:hypothetical protein
MRASFVDVDTGVIAPPRTLAGKDPGDLEAVVAKSAVEGSTFYVASTNPPHLIRGDGTTRKWNDP